MPRDVQSVPAAGLTGMPHRRLSAGHSKAVDPRLDADVAQKSSHEPLESESWKVPIVLAALAYVAAVPWESVSLPLGTPTQFTGSVFVVMWLWRRMRNPKLGKVPTLVSVLLVALVAWSLFTCIWSFAPVSSLISTVTFASLALSALALADVGHVHYRKVLTVLAVSSGAMSLLVWAAGPSPDGAEGRTFAEIDTNILAFNLSMGVAAALFMYLEEGRRLTRAIFVVMAVVTAGAVLLTASRTGLVSLLLISVLTVLRALSLGRFRFGLLLPSLFGLAWWYLSVSDRLPNRLQLFVEAPVTTDARDLIIATFQQFQGEWEVRGVGFGADADFLLARAGAYQNAHSAFWKLWIEGGVVALLLFGLLLVAVAMYARHSPARGFVFVSVGCIAPFFYSLGALGANSLWLVIGLALAGSVHPRDGTRPKMLRYAQVNGRTPRPSWGSGSW